MGAAVKGRPEAPVVDSTGGIAASIDSEARHLLAICRAHVIGAAGGGYVLQAINCVKTDACQRSASVFGTSEEGACDGKCPCALRRR